MQFPYRQTLLAAAFAITITAAPGVEVPQPVPPGSESSLPLYQTTGLIEGAFAWGSGVVAGHPRVVLSCAHVVYDDVFHTWTSGARWYRAYNETGAPDASNAQSLNGYFYLRSYSAAVKATARASDRSFYRVIANEFGLDTVAYFSYADDLGAGQYAEVLSDGAAQLAENKTKWITGYPGGRYEEGDPLQYRLHVTGGFAGPLLPEFAKAKNYVTSYLVAETGMGNSGGPVWTEGPDGTPSVAGVLVSGGEQETDGESWIGVHATSARNKALIEAAKKAAGQGVLVQTKFEDATGEAAIPDAVARRVKDSLRTTNGQITKVFRIKGMPKTINEVKIDLGVRHDQRTDLVVELRAPGGETAAEL